MKLVFLDTNTLGHADLSVFDAFGEFTAWETTAPEQRIERIRGHEVVIVNKSMIDREVIDACPEMKLVCVAATGMNNIDLEYARTKGVQVKNVAGYSTQSVVQVTFAALLNLLCQVSYFDRYVKSGEYTQSPIFTHYGREFWQLAGKKFGIIGLGTIGQEVARVANAFGCEVVYYSTSGKNNHPVYKRLEMEQFLKESDIVSIHAPLNPATNGLIDYTKICLMKPTAILTNMGRGGIVVERDLVRALNENRIAGAAIDVYSKEPMDPGHPYLSVNDPAKLILTPHVAWASVEARELLVKMMAKNIQDYLASRK